MKKIFTILLIAFAAMSLSSCACTIIDNSEVGLKFKKFSLTEQGKLQAEPASGYVFYNPFTEKVFSYPVFVQRVDYQAFKNEQYDKLAAHIRQYVDMDKVYQILMNHD